MIVQRCGDGIKVQGHSQSFDASELPKWTDLYKRMANLYGHRSGKYAETYRALLKLKGEIDV